jgi:hypothetical protein
MNLFLGTIAAHSHRNSEPNLIIVSSTTNSDIFLLLDNSFAGLYVLIHFQIDTWLLLTMYKKNALATYLVDNPRKYKCSP